jgi:hypothetical protein
MEQIPSWEGDGIWAGHEILWNPTRNFMKHECSLTCSQEQAEEPHPDHFNSIHVLTPYIFKILFNVIFSTRPRFSE